MIPSFSYIRARSVDEAVRYLSLDGARAHAGGTDLLGCLRERIFDVTTVVSIAGLKELTGIGETPAGGIRIGSLTTIAEVARNPVIRSKYRALSMAAAEVASPQLRHQGTIGGNKTVVMPINCFIQFSGTVGRKLFGFEIECGNILVIQ